MKFLNRLIIILVVAMLLATSIALLTADFVPAWEEYLKSLITPYEQLTTTALAVALLCTGMLIMLTGLKKKKKEKILSFKNDDGVIQISTMAISDYISKLTSEFPSVVRMHPEVKPHGNMIDITVTLRVKAGPQIHEICEVMQRRVRETMINGLGISDVRHVVVHVKEISPEHKSD